MSISSKILDIKKELPENVSLIAVSKYHPTEEVMEAYNAGQRIFGENIVQELRQKQQELPQDIQWHFLGHLQKNKIKYQIFLIAYSPSTIVCSFTCLYHSPFHGLLSLNSPMKCAFSTSKNSPLYHLSSFMEPLK